MNLKKNIRMEQKEIFDEAVVCEQCKKEVPHLTELVIKQEMVSYDGDYNRDFHFCSIVCLKEFLLQNKNIDVFKEESPLGFYFTEEDLK